MILASQLQEWWERCKEWKDVEQQVVGKKAKHVKRDMERSAGVKHEMEAYNLFFDLTEHSAVNKPRTDFKNS